MELGDVQSFVSGSFYFTCFGHAHVVAQISHFARWLLRGRQGVDMALLGYSLTRDGRLSYFHFLTVRNNVVLDISKHIIVWTCACVDMSLEWRLRSTHFFGNSGKKNKTKHLLGFRSVFGDVPGASRMV